MPAITFSLSELFSTATKASIYNSALSIATALGLPVTSWRPGDPTRSVYHVISEELETRDVVAASYAKSGFLDSAEREWLTILADQVFNVQREAATAAEGSLRIKNTEGGVFAWDAGDLVFRSSANGKTYHNTAAGSLSAVNEEVDVAFAADEDGADSSLATDELDEIVTAMPGVDVVSSVAASANDEEDDATLRARCHASTGALSPNGPADAYRFVSVTSELTGNSETTRAYVSDNATTGDVVVYLAGSAGAVSGGAITAVTNALVRYALPLCVTLDVQSAVGLTQAVTVNVVLRSTLGVTEATAEAAIAAAIDASMRIYPVGGINALFYQDSIRGAVFSVYGQTDTVSVSVPTPAANVAMTASQVIVPGTITVNASFV